MVRKTENMKAIVQTPKNTYSADTEVAVSENNLILTIAKNLTITVPLAPVERKIVEYKFNKRKR